MADFLISILPVNLKPAFNHENLCKSQHPHLNSPGKDQFNPIRQGDEAAFEALFRELYQPLCHYAHTYVPETETAEELVQETFVKLWERREKLEVHTSLRSYLFRAVRNNALNHLKHLKIVALHQAETYATGTEKDWGDSLIRGELEEKIGEAIGQLPEQCRKIFEMSRMEGLKYREIAEKTGISIKTVEAQMGKALRILREALQEYLPLIIGTVLYLTWIFFDT